jgi:hypothetical protein
LADANRNQAGYDALAANANRISTNDQANKGLTNLALPASIDLQRMSRSVENTRIGVESAEANLDSAAQNSIIIKMLEDAQRQHGTLGMGTNLRNSGEALFGDNLKNKWKLDRDRVNAFFANLPDGIPINTQELAGELQSIGAWAQREGVDINRLLGLPNPRAVSPNISGADAEAIQQALTAAPDMDMLTTIDLKKLIVNTRPSISREINRLTRNPATRNSEAVTQLERFRDWIDGQANQHAATNEALGKAMTEYRDYADRWLVTDELKAYDDELRYLTSREHAEDIGPRASEAGHQLWTNTEKTLSDRPMQELIQALGWSPELDEYITNRAINDLIQKSTIGGNLDSTTIKNAILPHLRTLENLNSPTRKLFEDTIEALEIAENGLGNVTKEFNRIQQQSARLIEEIQNKELSRFLDMKTGRVMSNPTTELESVFRHPRATDIVKDLVADATAQNNPLAVEGLKGELLRYIHRRVRTSSPIAVGAGGEGAVRESSTAALTKIVEGGTDQTKAMVDALFQGDPRGDGVMELLKGMRDSNDSRLMRVNPNGSNTRNDLALSSKINRLVTVTFGVLSRPGAIARSLITMGMGNREVLMNEAREFLLDTIITDPTFLHRATQALENDLTGRTLTDLVEFAVRQGSLRTVQGMAANVNKDESEARTEDINVQMRNMLSRPTADTAPVRPQGAGQVFSPNINVR